MNREKREKSIITSVASKRSHSSYEYEYRSILRFPFSIRSSSCALCFMIDQSKEIYSSPESDSNSRAAGEVLLWVVVFSCHFVFPCCDRVWYHFYTCFYILLELVLILHTQNIDRFRGPTHDDDLSTEQTQIEVCWETTLGSCSHCLCRPLVLLDHGRKDETRKNSSIDTSTAMCRDSEIASSK